MRKIDMITELYNRTLKELTSSNRAWMDFLKTAAFQYKYPFSDQVLIYAQRPGAVACIELEKWNERFGRWVNRGAHGIALIREQGGRSVLTHVFDVKDTHHREDIPFKLWEARPEMRRDISEALENRFGHLPMKATVADAAICACNNICDDSFTDYLDNLMGLANGSRLDEYDEDNMRVRFLPLLKYSTAYAVLTRLGYRAEESLDMYELDSLREFNTPEVINLLGTATGDISEICLREIERTVRAYEKNKLRTFADIENARYNALENSRTPDKGGEKNERGSDAELQDTRGSNDSRSEIAGADELSSGQVRDDAVGISEKASTGNLYDAVDSGKAEQAFARSGGGGEDTDFADYIPDGTEPWGNGANESGRPDEMGADDEWAESIGRGGSSEQPDFHINERANLPTPDENTLILALRHDDDLLKSKEEIVSFLSSEKDQQRKTDFIKNVYQMGVFSEFNRPGTAERIGYYPESGGLLIYEGFYAERKTEVAFTWQLVAELIEALAKDKNYLDEPKEDKQLSLLDMEENAAERAYEIPSKVEKPLAFSQEIIDEFIRLGGCTRESTERIFGYYRRAEDQTENIAFLKSEYQSDYIGLIIDGRKMSAGWDEDGLRIVEGDSVTKVGKSVSLSWADIDKRTRELIELGQYIPEHRAEKADEIYETHVADRIAFLYRDYFRDLPDSDKTVSRFIWPEITNFYASILRDNSRLETLCTEMDRNIEVLESQNAKYSNQYDPRFVLMLAKQFLRDPVEFKKADPNILPGQRFVTEDKISSVLIGGSQISEGKFRIYSFFLRNKDTTKRVEFLKDEYGIGGAYSDRLHKSHDGKGLVIAYGIMADKDKVLLTWTDVSKRIDRLIRQDKYLSEKEISMLDLYETKQVAKAVQGFYSNRQDDVPRPFESAPAVDFWDENAKIATQLENSESVRKIYSMMREAFESEMPDSHHYSYHKDCLETVKQYADGTYNLFPNSHFRKKAKSPIEEVEEITAREETTGTEPVSDIVDIDLSQSGYDIQLGSWVYIGTNEVMLQSVTEKGVELFDGTMFPLEMPYDVFLERLRENPLNDSLIKDAEGVIADREAEKAIDAHEREFGADGTRVFRESELEEPLVLDIEERLIKYVPIVSEAVSHDTAYCNACGHSDYQNSVIEGNAAIRRAVLSMKDMELLKLFSDNTTFRHELYPRVIASTYEKLHEMYRPMNQEDVDRLAEQTKEEKNYVPGIEKISPFEQYERLKEAHPDAIAAVRIGDFYEFFDEDAEKAAKSLELMMTSRFFPDGTRHPMCGFPLQKGEDFFEKLNDNGYNVAQCDGDGEPVILRVPKQVMQEQELQALSRLMRACRIDDITFNYENDVFMATDGENTWTRTEFYKFIKEEVLLLDEEGNTPDFIYVPDDVLTPVLKYIHEEELKQVMTDEELDELPVSTVINGTVETFPNAEAMLDALDSVMPAMQETPKPKPKTAWQIFHPEVDYNDRIDHKIKAEDLPLRVASDKYERNIRAIRLLHQLEDEDRLATESEQKLLADYSGWGGLSDRFDENHSDYEELKSILSPEEYTAARESTLTAFYTPPVVIKAMYKVLENMGFSRGNILEPSCGVGNFIGFLPESMSDSKVYGVELDSLSGKMAQQIYQKQNITVSGFEETMFPDSFFDVAIGNVPFGQFKVVDKKYDKYNFLIHDYFFGATRS